jgi:hypothetical protein
MCCDGMSCSVRPVGETRVAEGGCAASEIGPYGGGMDPAAR